MRQTVKAENLEIGMYVLLPKKWFEHPFLKNEFLLTSSEQIAKIIDAGIWEVSIDVEKSKRAIRQAPPEAKLPSPETLPPIIPPALQDTLADRKLPAAEKAKAIREHSVIMMQRLMENPSAENIVEAKKGIAKVVDTILADDKTNEYLLNITIHDYSTYVHSVNVGILAVSLAKSIFKHSHAHNMLELGAGFFLHDLGKVKIDSNIINKPAMLTESEMQEVRQHPQYGHDLLDEARQLTPECKKIVLQHHERYQGGGYPLGLQEQEIHVYGRICVLADIYEALTANRPYRRGLPPFEVLRLMQTEMGGYFQKELFQKFVLLFGG